MTSLQKSFSQIPQRSRLLFAIAGDSGFTQLKLTNAIAAYPRDVLHFDGTILNTTEASAFIRNIDYGRMYATGNVFRDMGKTLHVQTNGRTDYILTYVQQVQGPLAEGVPNDYNTDSLSNGNFWICTWTADIDAGAISMNVVRSA